MARKRKFPKGPRMTLAKNRIATARALAEDEGRDYPEVLRDVNDLLDGDRSYEDALRELGAEIDYEVPELVTGVAGGFDDSE